MTERKLVRDSIDNNLYIEPDGYGLAFCSLGDAETFMGLLNGMDAQAAEVERLRAELAALRPLAEAAVHYYCNEESDPDAHDGVFEAVREFGADFISRRAAAQQPSF